MSKKGQIDSHILAYTFTSLIVAGIILMGYKFIGRSSELMDRGEIIQFRNMLGYDIKSTGNDYGAFKKITYTLPKNLKEICFVDLKKENEILSSKLIDFYPIIKDSIKGNSNKNVFFSGAKDEQSFYIPDISITRYPFMACFHRKNGKAVIGIEGLGGGKSLIISDFVTQARINKDDKTVLQSSDEVITFEIPKGVTANVAYISIEMVEPSGPNKGASEIYKFGPSGAAFSAPAKLSVKYSPQLVGECPQKLDFYMFKEDGSQKRTLESKSIDCENKIVNFDISKFD